MLDRGLLMFSMFRFVPKIELMLYTYYDQVMVYFSET